MVKNKKSKVIEPVPNQDKLQFNVTEDFEVAFKNDDIFDKYGQVKKGKTPMLNLKVGMPRSLLN